MLMAQLFQDILAVSDIEDMSEEELNSVLARIAAAADLFNSMIECDPEQAAIFELLGFLLSNFLLGESFT